MNTWLILIRAHDIIWKDKQSWKPIDRLETCRLLFDKSLEVLHEQFRGGSVSTADSSESLIEREIVRDVTAKP